ncbi:MAG TPA: transposase [Solirubrobacteraceae bacterium]|nr:transposase [Solirubrobacteraceae bacterium]
MRDWVDEDHLAWFVIDVVGELDTSALHRRPGGAVGRRPYEPEMLCALVLYAYCVGVRSSRRIEDACRTDAAFRVICGGLVPDHATIARFVVDQERALEGLFVEGLRLCAAAGLCDLSVVALDGTKMAADAALDRNRDAAWIRREIAKLLSLTAAGEAPEPLPGARADAVGAGPAGPGGRLGRLRAALAVIEAEEAAAREAAREQAGALSEAARRGRAPHGRPPKDPLAALERARAAHEAALAREQAEREAARPGGSARAARRVRKAAAALAAAEQAAAKAEPASARQANVTDPDSRIMKAPGGWVQGYNAQAIANRHQIVLACDVSQQGADTTLYEPMTTKLADTLAAAGVTGTVGLMLADAGYWSHDNAAAPGPERLIATTSSHQQRRAAQQLGPASSPPPAGATPEAAMQHRLRTPEGAAAYAQRSCTIEPVFGDCKHNRAMRGFRRRGLPAAQSEWTFMHLAHNLGKLREHRTATATA